MRLLQRNFEVKTRYGGGFVQSIDGVAGGREGGRAGRLVLLRQRHRGRRRRRRAPASPPATASGGTATTGAPRCASRRSSARSPSRSCHGAGRQAPAGPRSTARATPSAPCDEVATRLEDAGVTGIARASIGTGAGTACCAIVVGLVAATSARDVAAAQHRARPGRVAASTRASAPGGRASQLLDDRGRPVRDARRRAAASSPRRASERPGSRPGSSPAPTTPGVAARGRRARRGPAARPLRARVEAGRGVALPVAAGGARAVTYRRRASPLHAARAAVGVAPGASRSRPSRCSLEHPRAAGVVLGAVLAAAARARRRARRAAARSRWARAVRAGRSCSSTRSSRATG